MNPYFTDEANIGFAFNQNFNFEEKRKRKRKRERKKKRKKNKKNLFVNVPKEVLSLILSFISYTSIREKKLILVSKQFKESIFYLHITIANRLNFIFKNDPIRHAHILNLIQVQHNPKNVECWICASDFKSIMRTYNCKKCKRRLCDCKTNSCSNCQDIFCKKCSKIRERKSGKYRMINCKFCKSFICLRNECSLSCKFCSNYFCKKCILKMKIGNNNLEICKNCNNNMNNHYSK